MIPLTHRELIWWIDLISDARPNWAALGRRSSVRPARLRDWQLDATELIAVIAVLDDDLTAAPAWRGLVLAQISALRSGNIATALELHEETRAKGGEHRCTVVSNGGDCTWETHLMRVFDLLPYEGWPPFGTVAAEDVDDGHVRARPADVLLLLAARIEWLLVALGPLGDRPLPPSMYQACPHCGYKWRMRPRASTAGDEAPTLYCPSCRVSIEAGHVIGPCHHCGATWRQRGPSPPARCPRCNKVRPVEEVTT